MTNDNIFDIVKRVEMPRLQSREHFVAYLKLAHAIMLGSEDLLNAAARQCTPGALQDYYERHGQEEKDHAQWLAEDINALGAMVDAVDHAAAAIVGAQYYYIRHVGPHVFLGYIAALEGNPMPLAAVDMLETVYGEKGCRTLRYHAEHDPDHGQELLQVIREHGGTDGLVVTNALITARSIQYHLRDRLHTGG